MAFNRFLTDIENIQKLDDRPQLTAQDLKACFDQAGVDIKTFINSFMEQLEATTSAANLGATALGNEFVSTNVQGILEELKNMCDLLSNADNITTNAGEGYLAETLTSRLNRIKQFMDELVIGALPTDFVSQLSRSLTTYAIVPMQVTLETTGWVQNTAGYYEYTIEDSGITQYHMVEGNMDVPNLMKLDYTSLETYDGGIKITTYKMPTENVVINLTIQKTALNAGGTNHIIEDLLNMTTIEINALVTQYI